MLDKEIYSYCRPMAELIVSLQARQRAIDTDQKKNWVYSDAEGTIRVTANQKYWNGTQWVYEDNDFGSISLKSLAAMSTTPSKILVMNGDLVSSRTPAQIRSDISAELSGSAASLMTTHINTSDPHGDRAYTDSGLATKQSKDNDLTAIAGLSSTGIAVRTATDTWAQRAIAVSGNGISVSNGNGVSGNPTISLSIGTGSTQVAAGNHTHDSRYYTETEVNSLLSNKENSITGTANKVLKIQSDGSGVAESLITDDDTGITVAGNIIGSGASFLQLALNTSDGNDSKFLSLCGGGSQNTSRGGFIAAYGNEHATTPGGLRLYAGAGNGTTTGAVAVSPRMYFGTRPTRDDYYTIALGSQSTLHQSGNALAIMNNAYHDGDLWRRRVNDESVIVTAFDGIFRLRTAAGGAADEDIANDLKEVLYTNVLGNTLFGKTTATDNSNKVEVNGNAFVNGNVKVSGNIIGSGDVLNLKTDNNSKKFIINGGGSTGNNGGGYVEGFGNTNTTRKGDLRLIAGLGDGTTTGAVEVSPRMYFDTRPTKDDYLIAINERETFLDVSNSLVITNNAGNNSGWKYRVEDEAVLLNLGAGGIFDVRTAESGAAGSAISWKQAIYSNSLGNTLFGKTTATDNSNKVEVNGNAFVNGKTATNKLNTGSFVRKTLTLNYTIINLNNEPTWNFRFKTSLTNSPAIYFSNAKEGDEVFVLNEADVGSNPIELLVSYTSGSNNGNLMPQQGFMLRCIGHDSQNYPVFAVVPNIWTAWVALKP